MNKIITDNSRPDIQRGHSMSVVCNLKGSGGCIPEAGGFSNLRLKNVDQQIIKLWKFKR